MNRARPWVRPGSSDRRPLLTVLAALGTVSVASGAFGILKGPGGLPGGQPTTSTVDSEYRFVNTFWLAAGAGLLWSLRDPDQRSAVTRATLVTASLGGLTRLLSWARTGPPHPAFRAATVLELGVVPAVLWWHARTVHPARTSPGPAGHEVP